MSDPGKTELRKYDPDNGRVDRIEQRIDQHDRKLEEQGKEIGKLKQFQSAVFGAAAAFGAVAGYLMKWIKGE